MNEQKELIDFLIYAEKLKTELRHASRSDNQRESVAEHSWRLALMVMLVHPKLTVRADLLKMMKLAVIHDIIEIDAKDVPVLEQLGNNKVVQAKEEKEREAIEKVKKMLGKDGKEIYDLWFEYENQETNEARVVRALDKVEGQLQFLSDYVREFRTEERDVIEQLFKKTTELCSIDPYLVSLYERCGNDFKKRTNTE